ncbi:hypothetical protein ES677_11385 [Bizionia gelidisalsuginis]|uniref:Uncharacterized protein n=1 Tax=Bizionia gelidisalsuginis TaxID=291188 RepID=A0ABY3M8U5_9FLAO|nr:hypothetical protein [Bizionia gelidisalsuginis]TYC10665.1 hypothetical protein ES677_11385 [Bizionia gelidisalsuginis]
MLKHRVTTCLVNFFIAAIMGLLLRYAFISGSIFNYKYLMHAHSHVAMLGWVYLMLFTFYVHYFVPEKSQRYSSLFWTTQAAVIGMMLSFPLQGYAAVSISFSTLHIFCSYVFVYRIWKDMYIHNPIIKTLVRASLIFLLVSTIGVWCLGPAVGLLGQASAFYQIAIQFFLHFQFNGWFLIAVIAILFHKLKIKPSKDTHLFLRFLIFSTVVTFALPIQWFANHPLLYWFNGLGILLQLIALYYFIQIVKSPLKVKISQPSNSLNILYRFSLMCLLIKIVLQTLSIIPAFSSTVYEHHNFVIGFIHLTMLGVVSGFLFAFLFQSKIISINVLSKLGVSLFLLGIISTELILFSQGALWYLEQGMLPHYFSILFIASILLPLGILILLISYKTQHYYGTKTIKTTRRFKTVKP